MVVQQPARELPGSTAFLGLPNIREFAERGLIEAVADWQAAYGDIFQVKLGPSNTMIFIIHPDDVRHVTLTHADNYIKGATYDGARKYLLGNGVLTSTGETWKRQRRLMSPFYTPRGVTEFADIMLRDTVTVSERWDKFAESGEEVEMMDEMALVTSSIILKAIFSTEATEDILTIKEAVETMISYVSESRRNPLALPAWVPTARNRAYQQARDIVDTYINGVLEARFAMDEADYPNDLLSKLILAEDPETGERMSRDLLRDEAITNFFAGYETSARTMSYAWYALAVNHDVRATLHAELDNELGDAVPTLDDLKRLPYTMRVIKETMRLYPPAPLYARNVVEDDVIRGYHIPAGAVVTPMPYYTHRHPDFWENPDVFEPQRHAPDAEKERHPQAYHPFASGKRICLGNHFSLLETHILLAILAKRYDPVLPEGYTPNFKASGTLNITNGLPMTIRRR